MSDNPSPIQIPIVFDLESQQAAQSLDAVLKLVAKTRQEVEAFANRGGLGQLAERSGLIDDAQNQITDLGITLARTAGEAELLSTAIAEVGNDSAQLDSLTSRLNDVQTEARQAVNELEQIPTALADSAEATRRTQYRESVNAISGLGGFEGLFTNTRGLVQSGGGLVGLDQKTMDGLSKILELGGDITGTIDAIPRALKGFEDLKQSLTALQAAGALSTTSLLASAGALAAVAAAAYGVSVAYKDSVEKATAPVKSFLEDLEDVDVSAIDTSTITSVEQLERLRQEQEAYAATLEENVSKTQGFVDAAEESGNVLLRAADAVGYAGYEDAVNAAKTETAEYNDQLKAVRENLSLLNSGLIEISLNSKLASEAFLKQLDAEIQRRQLLATGTTEDVDRLRQSAQIEIDALDEGIPDLQRQINEQFARLLGPSATEIPFADNFNDQLENTLEFVEKFGSEVPVGLQDLINTYQDAIDRQNKLTEDIQVYQDLTPQIQARDAAIEVVKNAFDFWSVTEEERQTAIEETTKANEAAIEAETKRNQQLLDDAAKTSQSLADLETRRAEALQKQREAEAEAAVVASFKAQIEAAKAVEAEQQRAVKVSSLRQEAQANELEAQQKHQATLARQQAQFDLQQRRREEDLADDLDEVAADRDVKSFLRIQKDGEKELDRAAEDNDLRLREQKESLDDQIREIRRSAEERIRAERDSGQRRLTQSQRLEQALSEYQANAAQQRQLRQRQIEEQAYQERVTALRTHMARITQELLNGVTPAIRGGLGAIGALPAVPAVANTGAGLRPGGAGAAIAITIQQQNVGRIPSHDDINRANQDLANKVVSGVNRALAGIRNN